MQPYKILQDMSFSINQFVGSLKYQRTILLFVINKT
jgi:hypothetical protein